MIPTTMDAWARDDYGTADGTRRVRLPVPQPRKGQVLLRVRATSLSAGDVRLLQGDPLLVRLAFGLRRPKMPVRGIDVAGTVVAVGEGVEPARIGDEVVVELAFGGGLAEYAVAPVDRIVTRPSEVDPVTAATLVVSAGSARQALDLAGVGEGSKVLVLGASSGVGTFAVQLAALRGAEVHGVCGAANRQLVERLGATRTFDYRATDSAALPGGYDAILDIAGERPLRALRDRLSDAGTIVLIGGTGARVLGPIPRMLKGIALSIGTRRSIRSLVATTDVGGTAELLALTAAGNLGPVIERVYGFGEADAALARIASGRVVGKAVVRRS